ncbi:MAG: MarR family transcriptional regulator [Steroidobacteraceae bacterium]
MTTPAPKYRDKLGGAPHSKLSLRLWLRLLSCSMILEKRVRARLDEEFGTTLPRFDVLSALERHPEGLTMGQLSDYIMVSNGNVTAVVNRLLADGWLVRTTDKADRRVATVRLTRKGRAAFLKMAALHEQWIDHMFQGLSDERIEELMAALGEMRVSIESHGI